ncbi:MAG: sensor histidine kinase [Jatrophihabitans sp.]
MNAAILLLALLLLVLTPITVSSSVSTGQVAVLLGAFAAMVVANAALLRVSFRGLIALTRRMETLDLLRPRERLSERGGAETRTLISGFNTMLDRLEADRRESTRRSVAALENERLRISRELHDEIGQRMTGIVLQLSRIHADVPGTVRSGVERAQDEARAVLGEIGALAWQIRPGILDDLGLLNALESLAQSFGDSGPARIESVLPQQLPPMSSEVELALYRITQEALTNAVRHSGARRISVRLWTTREELTLQVIDDGRGLCDADQVDPGLRGMRERALLIDARLATHENPPHGLRVELVVPISQLDGST